MSSTIGHILLYNPEAFKPNLSIEDKPLNYSFTLRYWYNIIIYSSMFLLLTTDYSVSIFQRLIPTLKYVKPKDLGNFVCQVTGTINCLYISLASVFALWKLSNHGDYGDGVTVFLSIAQVMTAYLIVDSYYKVRKTEQSTVWVLGHHLAAFLVCHLAAMDWHYLMEKYLLCLMECSNPFINMRIVLSILSYSKSTWLYKANALAMTGSFLVARVIPSFYFIPRGFYIIAYLDNYTLLQAVMFSMYLVISAMNYYWFYRMIRGIYVALTTEKIE